MPLATPKHTASPQIKQNQIALLRRDKSMRAEASVAQGTATSRSRLFFRLQVGTLPFFWVPWINFTHTLSCLNCTRNLGEENQTHSGAHKAGECAVTPAFLSERDVTLGGTHDPPPLQAVPRCRPRPHYRPRPHCRPRLRLLINQPQEKEVPVFQ